MGILSGIFRSRDKPTDRTAGSSYSFFLGGTAAGKYVTERSAMQMTAVYCCVRILSEAVASLPLQFYRYTDDGGKEKAVDHPLYFLLHDEPRAKLWNTMEGFLDTHRNEKGVLSAEDDAAYANMEKDLNDLSNEIRRMERRDAMEAELSKPVNQPITAQPERHEPEKQGRASNAYKEDFGRHLRGKAPIHNVLSESVDQDGGYIVPEEFELDIKTGLDSANVIRSIAKVITTHNDRKIPIAVGHSVASWTAENAAYT